MDTTKTLARHIGYGPGAILTRSDTDDAELAHVHTEALADEITDRYNAPLIILGMSHELRDYGDDCPSPQWHVIHEGERKLMTSGEMADVFGALGFVD